ncbi:DUF5068 domain-containing protein [Bacillus sp. REN10]|uniref:DUF5068 domain-containing protein n=1 Tax=Bacillus sp. REN10 TaxID=2782541 RepID=UPI00193B6C4B|nr:DUF5068 domain-containing protein [Bacillus sp. REN10]
MPKKLLVLATALVATAFISACGNDEEPKKEEATNTEQDQEATEEKSEQAKGEEKEVQEKSEPAAANEDFSTLISYMEEETEGTAKVVYESNEPQVHKMDKVSVSLDSYKLVELKDFHTDFSIPFRDETEGGVILAKYTVKNDLDKDVYYMPTLDITFTGAEKYYTNYKDLIPEEKQIPTKLNYKTNYVLKAGETVTGYIAYPFGKTDLAKIKELSTVTVMVPPALLEQNKVNSAVGSEGRFNLALNGDGAEKVTSNNTFYQDRATFDNMGQKKMLKEKSGINENQQIGDVNVTLDGYQFAEFTPNEVEAPRFTSFTNGIVLLTVKLQLDNKGTDNIGLSSISSKLTVNDGAQYLLGEGMLLNYKYGDLVNAGEKGELLQVFVLDKEQYEKIWKDKAFELEIGPMRNQEAKDISKGKAATFTLPN